MYIPIILVFIHQRKTPSRKPRGKKGNQPPKYVFVEDQIKDPYVLMVFHCSLQKLKIQQSPSIHIFLTLIRSSLFVLEV